MCILSADDLCDLSGILWKSHRVVDGQNVQSMRVNKSGPLKMRTVLYKFQNVTVLTPGGSPYLAVPSAHEEVLREFRRDGGYSEVERTLDSLCASNAKLPNICPNEKAVLDRVAALVALSVLWLLRSRNRAAIAAVVTASFVRFGPHIQNLRRRPSTVSCTVRGCEKVPILGGFSLENPTKKATASKLF